jgi:hypothetical protein
VRKFSFHEPQTRSSARRTPREPAIVSQLRLGACPVPDKSAGCQSDQPIRVCLPAIRSAELPVEGRCRCGHHRNLHEHACRQRVPGTTASDDRARSTGTKSSPTRSQADLDGRRRLDRLPLNQARPGSATVAGRLIWHGTVPCLERDASVSPVGRQRLDPGGAPGSPLWLGHGRSSWFPSRAGGAAVRSRSPSVLPSADAIRAWRPPKTAASAGWAPPR